MIGNCIALAAIALLFLLIEGDRVKNTTRLILSTPGDVIFAALCAVQIVRLIVLGRSRPRLSLGPLGLTDHTTGRGQLLWSDFSGVSRNRKSLNYYQFPQLALYADREVCERYNSRLPRWRQLAVARWPRAQSIKVRLTALDIEKAWLEDEIRRRIDQASKWPSMHG